MMMELVMNLVQSVDPKEKERAYRCLERFGIDRATSDMMVAEFYKEAKVDG